MKIDVTDVRVKHVRVQRQVGMRDRASQIRVLVGMRVDVAAGVTVRVAVH
jgi:hypothetical protein